MTRAPWLAALLLLGVTAGSCKKHGASASAPSASASTARSAASASGSAKARRPSGDASIDASVPPAPEKSIHTAAFDAFSAEIDAACQPGPDPLTTADMLRFSASRENCAREKRDALVQKLPPAASTALLPVAVYGELLRDKLVPRGLRDQADVWSRFHHKFLYAACAVGDYRESTDWRSRTAGVYRELGVGGCRYGVLKAADYFLDARRRDDLKAFAAEVRAVAPHGKVVDKGFSIVRAALDRLAALAPEEVVYDDDCLMCTLTDADFRHLEVNLDLASDGASGLAQGACGGWTALRVELGGPNACRELMLSYWLSPLHNPEEWNEEPAPADLVPSKGGPPPKDPGYRAFIEPHIRGCESLQVAGATHDERRRSALACPREVVKSLVPKGKPSPGFLRARSTFVTELCRLEGACVLIDPQFGYPPADAITSFQCPILASYREAFLVGSYFDDAVERFVEHMRYRSAWGGDVQTQSRALKQKLEEYAKAPPGPPPPGVEGPGPLGDAPPGTIARLGRLEVTAERAAGALCAEWKSLSEKLGNDCAPLATRYYLSYGKYLGHRPTE